MTPKHHQPLADTAALERAANAVWGDLRGIGGGFVETFRRRMDTSMDCAEQAHRRGDQKMALQYFAEIEEHAADLEAYLAYVAGER